MTATIQLDPDALEAAAKALYDGDPEGMNALGFGEDWDAFAPANMIPAPYYRGLTTTAVTAYIAAIEPKLREAVSAYTYATDMWWGAYCAKADTSYEAAPSVAVRNARAKLYALIGLETS